ncbi:hypothetical protein Afil01_32150 [Actinorhabdospora filicis]|uniref:FG-GAP repeat protein n=1 Tax=Actinorhabdospora filicis TaxID=1785913 RepID=A0A9W6SLF4_9ACTN|nr:VCBS repeat-containing protein [Actinorhabdospora filicis]GLZ78408.1 hypothetical protein Afil01_32150 [Actinorhabdospora filicis]
MHRMCAVLLSFGAAVVIGGAPPSASAASEGCIPGGSTDFNGDGTVDVAVADPGATVNGVVNSGRVHVLSGGQEGTVSLPLTPPGGAVRFGTALATTDVNLDGCDDLLVGAPDEAVTVGGATVDKAGAIYLYFGAQDGLGTPMRITQGTTLGGSAPEAGDNFGASLAAGTTASGVPFVLAGAPGESVGSLSAAGSVFYLYNGAWTELTEDSPTVEGFAEAGDRWGSVLAATSLHFAVGDPLEDISQFVDSGNVDVFRHASASNGAISVGFLNQEMPGQSGYGESGDHFGASLAMTVFTDGTRLKSLLAIGVPGEAMESNSQPDAGRVVATVTISDAVDTTELLEIHQDVADVDGASETGDAFGSALAIVNRAATGVVPAWSDLLLAVGIPGEEGGLTDQGGIQVFSLVGGAGEHDRWVDPAIVANTGWTPKAGARMGAYLSASSSHLFIGDPAGNTPALWAVPWSVVTGQSTTDPIYAIRPGLNGVPPTGTGTFGAAAV